ncbi:MAG: DNA-processing protein DprA [Candidatus Didemnitutus sp.]|nr:DNA-processing protein DprA [Candidatus Didemnitutus sp.]
MEIPELNEQQAFMILNDLPNIGPITLHRLLAEFGDDPVAILRTPRTQLERVRGVGPETSAAIVAWPQHFDLAREEERLAKAGATFLTRRAPGYPRLLPEINDPPIGLYRQGNYDCAQPNVAIVGSRRTTLYGQAVARKLGADLARLGFCVVSGLARGIDTAAHEGALSVEGRTVAVLGTGIDIIYPSENLGLYRRIVETGAVLSEFPFGRKADRQSFAMRNRIVSGMSEAVVVVESDVSGGAMITARFAGEQGRLLFAVPGRIDQPSSAGCHQLIRDGATLLTSVDDLLNELNYLDGLRPVGIKEPGGQSVLAQLQGELTESEQRLLEVLRGGAMLGLDALATETKLPTAEIAATLMMLELKKLVTKRADGTFEGRSLN